MTARHDKATVDQAIADVEHWVREQTNPLSTPASRTEAKARGRAALRVLADAVEELRAELDAIKTPDGLWDTAAKWHDQALAAEADRNKLARALSEYGKKMSAKLEAAEAERDEATRKYETLDSRYHELWHDETERAAAAEATLKKFEKFEDEIRDAMDFMPHDEHYERLNEALRRIR